MAVAGKFRVAADLIQEAIGRKAVPILCGGGDTMPDAGMRAAGRKRA